MSRQNPEEQAGKGQFLYTAGMIANLLTASVSTIRLLYRRNLLNPVKNVNKLLFFDAQDLYKARHLVSLIQHGYSPALISKRLEEYKRIFPDSDLSVLQLTAAPNGVDLLLNLNGSLRNIQGQPFLPLDPFIPDDSEELNTDSITAVEEPAADWNAESEEANEEDLSSTEKLEEKDADDFSGNDPDELEIQRNEICQKLFSSARSIFQFHQEDR
ncbi:MAG: hypothetical protein Q4G69_13780, partial [Planctomycetia bacterium]|nr:hypothetical protein [Planctomycetia bacterium]